MKLASLSSFVSFELTPDEELLAYQYTDTQIAGLQNELATCAEQLITVALEAADLSLEGAKKLAYTKGQIDLLKYLLARADAITEQRKEDAAAKQDQ